MDIAEPLTPAAVPPAAESPQATDATVSLSSYVGGTGTPERTETPPRRSRTRRTDRLRAPGTVGNSAPLVRPDGTPAPVVHLVPELSPYARTGGLGEAVASLAKYQAASGIPVTVFLPLYEV